MKNNHQILQHQFINTRQVYRTLKMLLVSLTSFYLLMSCEVEPNIIKIPISDSTDTFNSFQFVLNDSMLVSYNKNAARIEFYDLTEKRLIKNTYFEGQKPIRVSKYNDSLILLTHYNNDFALLDFNDNLVKNIYLNENISKFEFYNLVVKKNDTIVTTVGAKVGVKEFFKRPKLFKFLLNKDTAKFIDSLIYFPDNLQDGRKYALTQSEFLNIYDLIIVSHHILPDLYLYNLEGELVNRIKAESNYFKVDSFPVYYENTSSIEIQSINYAFSSLLLNEEKEVFYRFVKHPQSFESNGIRNDYFDSPFSIQVFDFDFNLIKEKHFPNNENKYEYNHKIVYNGELYISSNNPNYENYDEKHFVYEKVEF